MRPLLALLVLGLLIFFQWFGPALALPSFDVGGQGLYSTFLGGRGHDEVSDLAVDSAGNVFMVGETNSTDFPIAATAESANLSGSSDLFLVKLNASGNRVEFATYFGGNGPETSARISLGKNGEAWIAGVTGSSNLPGSVSGVDRYLDGANDLFLAKFNASTGSLIASTYLGGRGVETIGSVGVTAQGEPFVSGTTNSSDFPIPPFAYDRSFNGTWDGFVAVFEPNLTSLLYATYLGGAGQEDGFSSAAANDGGIWVTGATASADFPTTSNGYVRNPLGAEDIVLARLSSNLGVLEYSTLFGGSSTDYAAAVSLGFSGDVYITGFTESSDFPTSAAAFDRSLGGPRDAFVTVFKLNGTGFTYSTFLGGSSGDAGLSIDVDSQGRAYLAGWTDSPNLPLLRSIDNSSQGREGFLAVLEGQLGSPYFLSYAGGTNYDWAAVVKADRAGHVFAGGFSGSPDFPISANAPFANYSGSVSDGFFLATRLDDPPKVSFSVTPPNGTILSIFNLDASSSSDTEDALDKLSFRWDFDGDGQWDTNSSSQDSATHVFSRPGNYTVSLQVLDSFGLVNETSRLVVVDNTPPWAGLTFAPDLGNITTLIAFNASPTVDLEDPLAALQFRWDFEGDRTWDADWSSSPAVSHLYPRPGNYTAVLEARDTWGATNATSRLVRIVDVAPSAALEVNRTGGTVADVFRADASGSSDLEDALQALQFRWDWDGDGVADTDWSSSPVSDHIYNHTGNYSLQLEVRDTGGNTNRTAVAISIVNTSPTARLRISPAEGNVSIAFALNGSDSSDLETPGDRLTARWDYDGDGRWDSAWVPGREASHRYAVPGIYTIQLQVRDDEGLVANVSATVIVRDEAPAARLSLSFHGMICRSDCVVEGTFLANASETSDLEDSRARLAARFDFNGDGVWDTEWATIWSVNYSYVEAGRYQLRVEVRDSSGQSAVASLNLTATVVQEPAPGRDGGIPVESLAVLTVVTVFGVATAMLLRARRKSRR